jgi:hypothetical protein
MVSLSQSGVRRVATTPTLTLGISELAQHDTPRLSLERIVVAFVTMLAVLAIAITIAPSASALVDPESINKDVEITKTALESSPKL